MSEIMPSASESSITDSSFLGTCKDLGIKRLLVELNKTSTDYGPVRYVCSRDGDYPFIGRNLLIVYLARILAEGEEGLCRIEGDERVKLINDLSIYCYLKIPAEKQISGSTLIQLRGEVLEEKVQMLWRTTLLNSGWNSSPKHSIAQGWLFLTQYWDTVAAKHADLADYLKEAKLVFLKELYLSVFSHINSGYLGNVENLEKKDVFSVAEDVERFIPYVTNLFPSIDSILEKPLSTLQLIREQPFVRISDNEAVTVNPEQIFNDIPLRAMRRVINQIREDPDCCIALPKLRSFFGHLYEKHANELLGVLGSKWTSSGELAEGTQIVPEFNMTPDDSEHLSPDCLILSDSHVTFEYKFRELWDTEADLDDWIWTPLDKPMNRHNPAQLIDFLDRWKAGNEEIVKRYGDWNKYLDFKYLFIFHDAPAWLNSDEFRQYLKRKYADCNRCVMDYVFFTDIRNIEILSGIYSHRATRGKAPLVTQLVREWSKEQANQGIVTVFSGNRVRTPDDLIEYMTKQGIYIHESFKLPEFMQSAYEDCFDTLLQSMGFEDEVDE